MSNFSPDQQIAYDGILQWAKDPNSSQTAALTGFAGCGKTFVVASLATSGNVHYCTPTAQAASVLNRMLPNGGATTAHRFLREYKKPPAISKENTLADPFEEQKWEYRVKHYSEFTSLDLIVADEASMLSTDICQELRDTRRKVLFVGDPAQLGPINREEMPAELKNPTWHLSKLHRVMETHPLRKLGEAARSKFLSELKNFAEPGKIIFIDRDRLKSVVKLMWKDLAPEQLESRIFIADTNELRVMVNKLVRQVLFGDTTNDPVPGDRIVFLKNERRTRIYNGMRGTVISVNKVYGDQLLIEVQPDYDSQGVLRTRVERSQFNNPKKIPWDQGQASLADYAYASTCHKAQGDQFETVVTLAEPGRFKSTPETLSWSYTAISRAQEKLVILV